MQKLDVAVVFTNGFWSVADYLLNVYNDTRCHTDPNAELSLTVAIKLSHIWNNMGHVTRWRVPRDSFHNKDAHLL